MKIVPLIVLAIFVSFSLPTYLSAQSSSVQASSHSYTKDGKTYVVSKTIVNGKTTIETKIYDSAGTLLSTETTTKDAKPTPVKTFPSTHPTKAPISTPFPTTISTPTPTPTPIPASTDSNPIPDPTPTPVTSFFRTFFSKLLNLFRR